MLYALYEVKKKRIVREIKTHTNFRTAVEQAQDCVNYDGYEEIWVTSHRNDQDVLAVVDKEGVRYG